MKLLVFLTIWLDDIALLLGMLFMTNIHSYKIYVIFIICMDIVGTIVLGFYFNKDKKRVAKVMKDVILETVDGKFIIKGKKNEIEALLEGVKVILKQIDSDSVKLIIDKEKK